MTMDGLVGIIPTVVAAGVVQKVTTSMFPTPKSTKHRKGKRSNGRYGHPGNFSNVGL